MDDVAKPSDVVRDAKFHNAETLPFRDEEGYFHVFSYRDVMQVLVNRDEAFSRDPSPFLAGTEPSHMAFDFMWGVEPFTLDGEKDRHDVLRKTVEPWFRNRAVRTMAPIIKKLTVDMINEVVARGSGEVNVATDLSSRLSMRVICELTGIEVEREEWMREKLDEFSAAPYADLPPQFDLQVYFWQLVAKRLAHPADELLDVIVDAWKDEVITNDELIGYIFGFVAAGTDTTGASLANAFTYLAEFDYLNYVSGILDDDDAMKKVVEEILRFGTPFPMKPLYVRKDSQFGELNVPAGSVLTIWFAAANRDITVNGDREQSDPNVFDPTRWPNRHLGLGWGGHHCLGAELARLETKTLLTEALRRLPGLQMDPSRPFVRNLGIVDMVTEAHFTFDQVEAEKISKADSD